MSAGGDQCMGGNKGKKNPQMDSLAKAMADLNDEGRTWNAAVDKPAWDTLFAEWNAIDVHKDRAVAVVRDHVIVYPPGYCGCISSAVRDRNLCHRLRRLFGDLKLESPVCVSPIPVL